MAVDRLIITVEFSESGDYRTYHGTVIMYNNEELYRRKSADFKKDYERVFGHALSLRKGRIICLSDELLEYRAQHKTHGHVVRTRFKEDQLYGKQRQTEALDEGGDCSPEPNEDQQTDFGPLEPETPDEE